jgi:hypothetical protein
MKVFLSSLIAGFEPMRAAARIAIVTLRHEPVMAEDYRQLAPEQSDSSRSSAIVEGSPLGGFGSSGFGLP